MVRWYRLEKVSVVEACLDFGWVTCPKFYRSNTNLNVDLLNEAIRQGRRGVVSTASQARTSHNSQGMSGVWGSAASHILTSSYFQDSNFRSVLIGVDLDPGDVVEGANEGGLKGAVEVVCLKPAILLNEVKFAAIFHRGNTYKAKGCEGWDKDWWRTFFYKPSVVPGVSIKGASDSRGAGALPAVRAPAVAKRALSVSPSFKRR